MPHLAIRIGIHLGEVVISRSGDVYGDAANVAARVQSIAEPDRVVITEAVFRSLAGKLPSEALGPHELRGVAEKVPLYEVFSPDRRSANFHAAPIGTLVGRQEDLFALQQQWEKSCHGRGRLITLVGEAGVGKSRLLREFRSGINERSAIWLSCSGSEIFRGTPFFPIGRLFEQLLFGTSREIQRERRRARLRALLRATGTASREAAQAIGDLLWGVTAEAGGAGAEIAGQRGRLIAVLVSTLLQVARDRPTVLALEDVQWFDPSTLEVVELLAGRCVDASLLIVMLARPEFRPSWAEQSHHSQITLGRLDDDLIRRLVVQTAADNRLADGVVDSIVARSSGIPLFAEELAQLLRDRAGSARESEVPETLSASLNARLDRLGDAREVAQVAAVIGDEFAADVLAAAVGRTHLDTESILQRLVEAEVLVPTGRAEGATFNFKHALLRDAAYETLLRSRRRELHETVAEKLLLVSASAVAAHPELVARHLSLAGRAERAAAMWHQAGIKAAARGGFLEAERDYQRALEELSTLPESRERDIVHMNVLDGLLPTSQVTHGYSATKTLELAGRLKELTERVGSADQLMMQMFGRWAGSSSGGRYVEAAEYADQFMDVARRDSRPDSLANAHMISMTSRYRLGDLLGAERYFAEGETLFSTASFQRRPGAVAQTFGNAARNAWMLGRFREARRRMNYALDFAAASDSTYDKAFAQYMAAILAVLMRKPDDARRLAEQSIELSDRERFPQFAAISRIVLGRSLVEIDRSPAGIELIARGIEGMTGVGSGVAMTLYLAWLAEAQAMAGLRDEARQTIDRALTVNPEERFVWPELLRLDGELTASVGDAERGIAGARAALALASRTEARGLQLRAAISLHRMLVESGRGSARATVAAVLRYFTSEGEEADIQDATEIAKQSDKHPG